MHAVEMGTIVFSYKDLLEDLNRRIWEAAELKFQEHISSSLLKDTLQDHGFTIEDSLASISTAFSASFGQGEPVIGILAEYDALSGMSQKADVCRREPIIEGGSGHGCGHNLLGVGALGAALAVKKVMEERELKGTVVLFGCPGEEGGSGKTFMARSGVFNDLDAALTWHPGSANAVMTGRFMANIQVEFLFSGISSHAASSPHLGRSALDAVELMNVGANYLREHTDRECVFHYAVTDTGGIAPNVVQAHAAVVYLIRSATIDKAKALYERIVKISRGAAMMTETEVQIRVQKACSHVISNRVLEDVIHNNFTVAGVPRYTDEELAYMSDFASTLGSEVRKNDKIVLLLNSYPETKNLAEKLLSEPVCSFISPHRHSDILFPGSSDVGDVSQIVPTAQMYVACEAQGTPAHSWQMVAQGISSVAVKGAMKAAEVLGMSVIDCLTDREMLIRAKEAFFEDTGGKGYQSPIPGDVHPVIG